MKRMRYGKAYIVSTLLLRVLHLNEMFWRFRRYLFIGDLWRQPDVVFKKIFWWLSVMQCIQRNTLWSFSISFSDFTKYQFLSNTHDRDKLSWSIVNTIYHWSSPTHVQVVGLQKCFQYQHKKVIFSHRIIEDCNSLP